MVVSSDPGAELESCRYLFVRDIFESGNTSLRVVVEEGIASPEVVSHFVAGVEISGLHRVESNDKSRLFEINWNNYVAFSVRNESYASSNANENVRPGRKFQTLLQSHFIDYVSRATFATSEYPGPMTHYCLNCENHIVDVISTEAPSITRVRPA